jgi:hypothetical protein
MSNLSQSTLGERLNRRREEQGEEQTWAVEEHDPGGREEPDLDEKLARGRSPATPFMLLGSVALAVWTVAALVTLAALLIWWLV